MLNTKKLFTKIIDKLQEGSAPEIDWSSSNVQAETRGGANPFTVNFDGWLCGWFNNLSATSYGIPVTVNGAEVAAISSSVAAVNSACVGVPVKQGDSVSIRIVSSTQQYSFKIYPYVGGVIRTLKNAISNLYREGVAVC